MDTTTDTTTLEARIRTLYPEATASAVSAAARAISDIPADTSTKDLDQYLHDAACAEITEHPGLTSTIGLSVAADTYGLDVFDSGTEELERRHGETTERPLRTESLDRLVKQVGRRAVEPLNNALAAAEAVRLGLEELELTVTLTGPHRFGDYAVCESGNEYTLYETATWTRPGDLTSQKFDYPPVGTAPVFRLRPDGTVLPWAW